jgi:hypothetical protein
MGKKSPLDAKAMWKGRQNQPSGCDVLSSNIGAASSWLAEVVINQELV